MEKLIFNIGVILMINSGCTKSNLAQFNRELNIHFPPVELNLDPHKMEDAFSMTVVLQIHRGLLRYSPGGDVIPDIATEWNESADHKRYTFKLSDTTFSNGVKLTAQHVQLSFARLFFVGAAIGADIDFIEGASEFRKNFDLEKLGIKVLSSNEVEFRLTHPSALFIKLLAVADCAIFPLTNFKEDLKFDSSTGYSGPYRVSKKDENGGVTIEAWRKDKLQSSAPPQVISFLPTQEAPLALALAGRTDCLDHDPLMDADRSKFIKAKWTETVTELIAETYVILNPKKVAAPVREAMVAAISQTEVAKLLGEKYTAAFGVIPRGLPGELHSNDYPHTSALAKINSKKSKNLRNGKIDLQFDPNNHLHQKIQSYLKSKWEALGIVVNLVPLAKRELLKRIFSGTCEICIGQKGLDYPDGFSVLTSFKSEYPANHFHVQSKKIDELINNSAMILNKEERESSYREIQRLILREHTLLPLAFGSEASGLWSPKVKAVPPHIMGYHMLPFETIEMAAK